MGLRVLVADDEEDILEVIQDRLEACGFTVITATNGAEALRKITTERFDGVFLDVKMPEMTGIEVLAAHHHYHFVDFARGGHRLPCQRRERVHSQTV